MRRDLASGCSLSGRPAKAVSPARHDHSMSPMGVNAALIVDWKQAHAVITTMSVSQ